MPAVGGELREGSVALEVSGWPLFVLRGALPTYRGFGPGDRGLTLTGADRGEDGGRGRTWVGRWSRRVVIARDCRTATGERQRARFPHAPRPSGGVPRWCGALYSGAVVRVTTFRRARL